MPKAIAIRETLKVVEEPDIWFSSSRRSWNALEQTDLFANETAVHLRPNPCSANPSIIHNFEEQMISLGINPDYRKQTIDQAARGQVVGDDIPMIDSVFDLKSGARAKLVDRSGSMVIIEIDKYRSDWIEWSAVKARIAAKDR